MNTLGCIIIVLVILLVYCIFVIYPHFDPSKKAEHFYGSTSGHTNDSAAQNVIRETKKIKNPTPLEKFRAGEVLLNNIGDIPGSQDEYIDALKLIGDNPADEPNLFILDRIEADYINNDYLAEDAEMQHHIINQIPRIRDHVTHTRIASDTETLLDAVTLKTKTRRKVDTLDKKQTWTHDTQSVHDSHVAQSIRDSFHTIKQHNTNEFGPLTHDVVNRAVRDIRTTFDSLSDHIHQEKTGGKKRSKSTGKIRTGYDRVLKMATEGFKVYDVGTEQEVITEIWRRISSSDNTQNKESLQQALYESMDDCIENGNLVCTQGRVAQMLQSMSHLDVDKNVGSMNTTEALRNDVYKNASDILNNNIKSLSGENTVLYNSGKHNDKINTMEDTSREEITEMVQNTEGLTENQKTNLTDECIAVV